MSNLGRFALLLATGCGLAACAGVTGEPTVPLPRLDPATIHDRGSAEQALETVSAARQELERSLGERERACYKRFLLNSCLEDVMDERRLAERRFRQIEIRSREVIRQSRAIERATEEAKRIEERSASDAAERRAADSAARTAEHEQRLQRHDTQERQRAERQDKSAGPNDGKGDLKPENRDANPAKD